MAGGCSALNLSHYEVLSAIIALLLIGAGVRGSSKNEFNPKWVLDLRQIGYERPKRFREQMEDQTLRNQIIFLDDDTLAVSLIVLNPNPGLSVRNKHFGGNYLFQTTFLDARSGKILRTQTWSNAVIGCGLFPTSNGSFVVQHGLVLSLHYADGTVSKTLSLDSRDHSDSISLTQSPSGSTLYAVRVGRGEPTVPIRTSDLEILAPLNLPEHFSEAASDSYVAYTRGKPATQPIGEWIAQPTEVFVRAIRSEDAEFAGAKPIITAPGCDAVVFLDNETVGVSHQCHELVILNKDGKVLYQQQFKKELTNRIVTCRSCNLFAFNTYVLRGGNALLDTFPHVKRTGVYLVNWKTGRLVGIPKTISGHIESPEALSPDGCLLAFRDDSYIGVYQICDSTIGTRP